VIAISIDGELVAPDAAAISVLDRGLLYGDGLFEVLRTWNAVAVDLDPHLDRLYESADAIGLRVVERSRLTAATYSTVAAGGPGEHRIRIVVTSGPGALSDRRRPRGPGRSIVVVEPLSPQPTELALVLVDWTRPLPHKVLAYLDHVAMLDLAARAGADEVVRLDGDEVIECATANLFIVAGGAVATPPRGRGGILPGITRAHVLALCGRLGIAAAERRISRAELRAADEVFATSAVRGVVPVTRLEGVPLPAGPVTEKLAAAYIEAMQNLL
jgi:branched-chain amino acid aminotransferase